jgi:putative nucleotidyltransferase with HDIG domain
MVGTTKKLSRLGQWNGRRRSSHDSAGLPGLWQRPVLVRLAIVALTTAVITLMAWHGGPPLPYRVGEVYPFELRVRSTFQVVNQLELINQSPPAPVPAGDKTATPGDVVTKPTARPVVETYSAGFLIVPRGEPITSRELVLLEEEHRAFLRSQTPRENARRAIALLVVFGLLAGLVVLYVGRFQTSLARNLGSISSVCLLVVVSVGLAILLQKPPWHAAFIPLTMTAMILAIAFNPQFALLMSSTLTLVTMVALDLDTDMRHLVVQMSGLAITVLLLRGVRTRTGLVKVGVWAGLVYLIMTVATGVLCEQTWQLIGADSVRNFLWGTLAGFLLTGILPFVERWFGIITDVRLLELADGSHPLLQELVRRAPGTYTHSMTVATLAEAAAESIGAHALLVRVGSYFHDIGKMLKPHYFIENQAGENRHDSLEPALSTLIIIGHVKDGLALAAQYRLPEKIVDFIEQHHGTTLVEYFYREALRMQENHDEGRPDLLEPAFRYPGPKPQDKENAVLMLADAVESASRSMREPTPNGLRKLVQDITMKRLLDGQFEESTLTLTELQRIQESLSKSLIAIHHSRVKYPDPPVVVNGARDESREIRLENRA